MSARDFSALRGKLENWEPADLASLIISLPVEDQVIVFRILPRELAADVFEYLDLAAQELLLKTMAKDDVAALLNDMAPDDRTHLLDELPAAVTKQMLSLLTPQERINCHIVARLSGREHRPAYDAGLRQRPAGLDDRAGAGPYSEPRSG
jgi:Mg/Co/Ni transporter MgtE